MSEAFFYFLRRWTIDLAWDALKLAWRAWGKIPSEVFLVFAAVLVGRTATTHGGLDYYSFPTGFMAALAFATLTRRWATWTLKRVLHNAAKPRTLVKGQPTDPGEPPTDPDTLLDVRMSKGAAYKLRAALIRADARLNPDFRHPDDDPLASHAEWLMWCVGRIEVAEQEAAR